MDRIAVGDLDGDGVDDAAVIFELWGGGTGHFFTLAAIRSERGKPVRVADLPLGDRVVIQGLTVQSGRINVQYLTQGPNDGMCCPTQRVDTTFVLHGNRLDGATSATARPSPARESPQPVEAPKGRIFLQFGATRPEHEIWRAWVSAAPQFQQHLNWLGSQLALPQTVVVVFQSCGTANSFYDPRTKSITICYEWILKRAGLVRASLPMATPPMVTDAVVRSTIYVIDHEMGHAVIDLFSLPVIGREEDAADGFSAFILLTRGTSADAYSVLQGALSNSQHQLFDGGSVADVHSLNSQRFFNMVCWMLGSDPTRFAGYAQQAGLPLSRQSSCPHEWVQLRASWTALLGNHLTTVAMTSAAPTVGVTAVPVALVNNQTIAIGAGRAWVSGFRIQAPNCRARLNVVGIQGGNLDVTTSLFDKYNYDSWISGAKIFEPVFQGGQVRQLAAVVPIKGPGEYVLIVSNKFSVMTPKSVKVSLTVACP